MQHTLERKKREKTRRTLLDLLAHRAATEDELAQNTRLPRPYIAETLEDMQGRGEVRPHVNIIEDDDGNTTARTFWFLTRASNELTNCWKMPRYSMGYQYVLDFGEEADGQPTDDRL